MNRNYNEAIKYHKLRKCKRSTKTDKSTDPEEDEEEGMEMNETSAKYSDEEVEILGKVTAKPGEEQPKLPQKPKMELTEQELPPASE